jgi:CBS domain-containing protein
VPDLRPGGLACSEDELVEERDRKQDGDEAGDSAPAPRTVLTGRPRQAHRLQFYPFRRGPCGHDSRARVERGYRMGKTIQKLMTPNPRTVTADATLLEAAKAMRDEDAGVIPVVDGDRLVGVVTDRDIVVRAIADGKDPGSTKVGEIASKDLITVDPQQELAEALRLMAQYQVRRLPVVEEDGRLAGIVAQADIARAGDDVRTGEVVEQISQ